MKDIETEDVGMAVSVLDDLLRVSEVWGRVPIAVYIKSTDNQLPRADGCRVKRAAGMVVPRGSRKHSLGDPLVTGSSPIEYFDPTGLRSSSSRRSTVKVRSNPRCAGREISPAQDVRSHGADRG